jgi:ABC-type dipeptide/oligopeptide/nickel transport system permease subunit
MTVETTTSPAGIVDLSTMPKSRSLGAEAAGRLFKNKAAIFGIIVIAPIIVPHDPLQMNSGKDYLPPAWVEKSQTGKSGNPDFILGTDTLGRDVLSRVIYGARVSMIVGFLPTTVILIVGTSVGMLAGFIGGRTDNYLMRFTDVVYAFPDLLFFIIVMVALRDSAVGRFLNGLFLLFIALAIVGWVGVARLVRGQVLSLKQKEFIEAARSIGAKSPRIMKRHLLPNTVGVLVVSAAFLIPSLIITEAILGYLGLGLRPATDSGAIFITSWGGLLLEGNTAINAQPWMLLAPAICIALVVLAFTFLGDGLRDALDPRMRGTQ